MVTESQFRPRCNLVSHFCSWQLFCMCIKMNDLNLQTLIIKPAYKERHLAAESLWTVLQIKFIVEEDEALHTYVAEGRKESVLESQVGNLTTFTSSREMLDVK